MKPLFTKEKHYNTLNNYYLKKYNKKTFKVPLNGGFTCPNRDGKLDTRGCLFCSESGSGEFSGNINDSLKRQFFEGVEMMSKKWKDAYYIAYFQANTNTYASVSVLKEKYESLLNISPLLKEISISTRADAIDLEIIDYLKELNKKIPVQIELGLQSSNERTLKDLNRYPNNQNFVKVVNLLHDANIEVVVHIINGLPGETKEDMLETINFLNKLPINGIKIHMLNILKTAPLYKYYLKKPFHILTKEEFVDITVNQIRLLRNDIIIHRITGDGKLSDLVEPKWIIKKFTVINDIDKMLRLNNFFQGDLYNKKTA